jgi:hypothetical protein
MELSYIKNNFLVSIVYVGSVWISCMSYSELNKVLANKNSSSVLIGLNFMTTLSSFTFLGALTKAILKPSFTKN